jgi:hypothetical protein
MWDMLVIENPRILLIPNFPKDKQGEGGHGFAARNGISGYVVPPCLD